MRSVESSGVASGRGSEREAQLIEAWSEGKLQGGNTTKMKKRRVKRKEKEGRQRDDEAEKEKAN